MADLKTIRQTAIGKINAAVSILEKFPKLDNINVDLVDKLPAKYKKYTDYLNDPISFLVELFKSTAGYNTLISITSKFISTALPLVEASIKTLLIAKLKDVIACSVNPFLTEDIIRNGVVFNLHEIDLIDMLKYSPFDNEIGKFYYFDIEEALKPDDLLKCNDMNALLWYAVNKASRRIVWKPEEYRKTDGEFRDGYPLIGARDEENKLIRLEERDGIVTLEFREGSGAVDAYGDPYKLQTPYNNVLHVFIGDTREYDSADGGYINQSMAKEKEYAKNELNIKQQDTLIQKQQAKILKYNEQLLQNQQNFEQGKIDKKTYDSVKKSLQRKIKNVVALIGTYQNAKNELIKTKHKLEYQIGQTKKEIESNIKQYLPLFDANEHRNYYYGKTLIQFNIDYITSLKLFDEKTLTARLLDCITGMLTIDLKLPYHTQLLKYEVNKLVEKVVENDDLVVSDCFFNFTNDDYDTLSREAELRKANLFTINGEELSAVEVNAEDILNKINNINPKASKDEVQTIIEGTLTELSKELSDTQYEITDSCKPGIEFQFIENILKNLAFAMAMSVLSPKVYLILLINLKIIGRETNFNLTEFLAQYKQLIADIIRLIRDQILKFFQDALMDLLNSLKEQLASLLNLEQVKYWERLLQQLINAFNKFKQLHAVIDFNTDNVDYADILPDNEEQPKNSDC